MHEDFSSKLLGNSHVFRRLSSPPSNAEVREAALRERESRAWMPP
jgi:hypothetical protein